MARNNSPRPHGPMGRGIPEKPKNFRAASHALLHAIKPYRMAIAVALLFTILATVLSLISPTVTKLIGEEILNHYVSAAGINFRRIAIISIIILSMYILGSVFNFIQSYLMAGVSARLTRDLRNQLGVKINKLPLKYFDKTTVGDILSRITNDLDTLTSALNESLSQIISGITLVVGALIMMFVNSWQLSLITLAATPINLAIVILIVTLSQKYFVKQQKELGAINGHIEEIYSAHNVVTVFNGAQDALDKFDVINGNLTTYNVKANFMGGLMHPAMEFVGNIVYAIVTVVGGIMCINNPLFLATVGVFLTYSRTFNNNITQMASISSTIQTTLAASERVFEFLNADEEPNESDKPVIDQKFAGNVQFANVCFGYTPDKEIIHNFTQSVRAGQKVAIVGPTGAGKTTLVNLLMRFYEINSGSISVDGVSISDMTRTQLRSLFGMVLQDTWTFEGTVRDNLKFGNPSATDEQMEAACMAANIDHIIKSLPGGYDHVITDTSFSAGEKQLLTIARAMISNSPMLILDEATSSVDTRTEELIQKAMDVLMQGRTSFIIAHRLSTIKNADVILVMRDGNIVEKGKHSELMAMGGFYSDLYNSQFSKQQIVEE